MRAFVFLACFVVPVGLAAQSTKSPPANAQKSQTKAPATKTADTKAADTRTAAQQSKTTPTDTKARPGNTRPLPNRPGQGNRPAISVAPETEPHVEIAPIMREAYDYDAGGRRDPFVSLLSSEDLRPMISDLRLVSILYDESGRRPIAVMRDVQNNTQYRVTTGSTLGRLKVALIKRKVVIFSIEEFGLNRQDSLVLGDTTKARTR